MRRRFLFLSLIAVPAAAQAQTPDIVVTGRGLDAPRGDAVYDVLTLPRDRLALLPSNRLEDALRDVPGFQLFRRSDARSANPTSQGMTLRALGGNAAARALLILDGVPQTDPFGGWISWPAYDPRRLGIVRVVRGGGSGTAGAGALAGTIELESAGPETLGGLTAALSYGSRESVEGSASLGLPLGAGYLTLGASHARGDGFIPIVERQRGPVDRAAPYEQTSLSLRAVAPIGADLELQAGGLWFDDARERGTAFSAIATSGADASLRLVGRGVVPFSALVYVQTRDFSNSFASVNAARTSATQTSNQYSVPSQGLGARIELAPHLGPLELRIGADARETQGETRELFSFTNGAATRIRNAGGRTVTVGAFAEASLTQGPWLFTLGGRIDHWRIEDGHLVERVIAGNSLLTNEAYADRAGWKPTARGGVAWTGGPLTLRAAAYLGWRLPTLNELYRPFRVGVDATAANADLLPERLTGAEIGATLRPAEGIRLSATAFVNRLDDAIANITLGRGPGAFPGVGFVAAGGAYRRRGNLDAIESRGVELDAAFARGPFSLTLGYAFADAEVSATGPAAPLHGLRPAQTPRHSASATLAWRDEGRAASLSLRYAGDQYEDDLNRQLIPDALTIDAAFRWPVTRGLAFEARAENIGDEEVVAGINGDGIIERAAPRTLWIGLSIATR